MGRRSGKLGAGRRGPETPPKSCRIFTVNLPHGTMEVISVQVTILVCDHRAEKKNKLPDVIYCSNILRGIGLQLNKLHEK